MRQLFAAMVVLLALRAGAQELYPNSEPASIMPARAIGVRSMNEIYNNGGSPRLWNGTMLMYGINSRWMINAMVTGSNHHAKALPPAFVNRNAEGRTVVEPNPGSSRYPYLAEALSLGFRYRFVNADGDHRHFRMAAYANGIYSGRPHDEAEVTQMGDNSGLSGGLISTVLIRKLAVSLTTGIIRPVAYREKKSGWGLEYSDAFNYSLSFGYLVYPRRYKSFDQTNINLYAEFLGKTYGDLAVSSGGRQYFSENAALRGGSYLEVRPAIQFIVRSNLRIDLGTALPLVRRSYLRKYPLYQLNVQYYFFRK